MVIFIQQMTKVNSSLFQLHSLNSYFNLKTTSFANFVILGRLFTMFYILIGVGLVLTYLTGFARDVLVGCQEQMITTFYEKILKKNQVPRNDMRIHKIHLSLSCLGIAFVAGSLFYTGLL